MVWIPKKTKLSGYFSENLRQIKRMNAMSQNIVNGMRWFLCSLT